MHHVKDQIKGLVMRYTIFLLKMNSLRDTKKNTRKFSIFKTTEANKMKKKITKPHQTNVM